MISLVTLSLLDIVMLGAMCSLWPGITNSKIRHPESEYRGKTTFMWITCVIFCIYAGWDTDYMHYYKIYIDIADNPIAILTTHLEIAYYPFVVLSAGSYSLFRFLVWGLAMLLMVQSLKQLKLNNNMTAITFVAFNLLYFSYARVSLAMMLYIYGFVLLRTREKRRRVLKTAAALLLIIVSVFFHKSMLFVVMLTPLAFTRLTKGKMVAVLLLLPVLLVVMRYAVDTMLASLSNGSEEEDVLKIGTAANTYSNMEGGTAGPIGMLISLLETGALLYGLYLAWTKRKLLARDAMVGGLFNITAALILLSVLSSMVGLAGIIGRRITLLSYLCIFFVLSYIFTHRFRKKEFLTFSMLALGFTWVKIVYYLYVNKVYGF